VNAQVIDDRYRLDRKLGHGSMGEVWLARDLELDRRVALKLLAPDADHARFEREAKAAAGLAHQNVTRLYDYGEADGRPYIVFEYLPGGTLEERFVPGRPLPDEEAKAIATELAAGLAHAHAHGLVHRDLKPANVLFDDEDRPKIADFGIASIAGGPTLTEAGTVLGTAAYISPEQAAGKSATPASDVYSFGVILFRMLTGRLPFESESPLELADMHRRLDAPDVHLFRPDAPGHLAAAAADALARDPRARLPDGAALAQRLDVPPATSATSAATVVLPGRRRRSKTRLLVGFATLLIAATGGLVAAYFLTRGSPAGAGQTVPSRTHETQTTAPTTAPATSSTRNTTTAPATAPTTAPTTTPPPPVQPPTTSIPTPTTATTQTTTAAPTTTLPGP
jgi:eukaryotic-like serine/threonine-protein kinase